MDMFRTNPAAPAAAPVATPAVAVIPGAGNIPPDGVVDGTVPGAPVIEQEASHPLDEFKGLWETDPNAKPAAGDAPVVPLDAAKLTEVVNKANFAGGVTADQMALVQAGGPEALTAMAEIINASSRQVMTQSTLAANKMVEQAVKKATANQTAALPDLLRQQAVSTANPIFSNPAVKPVMEAVQSQLLAKNPTATPQEIAEMSQNFVMAMGESFAPPAAADPNAPVDTDWTKFVEEQL